MFKKKISASELLDQFQIETVRSCKFGSTQSEVGSPAATSIQSEVVNVVQHASLRQSMTLSAVTQVQPEFARGMQKKQGSLKALSEHAEIRR